MIGLIMAGGRGTRMNLGGEKLLLRYKKPVILHVVDALRESRSFTQILAVTSPNSPETRDLLEKSGVDIFESLGTGYVEDLNSALRTITGPVFVVSGDMPLLDSKIVQKIVGMHSNESTWTSILVTRKFLDSVELRSDAFVVFENKPCCYTGISLVNPGKISSLDEVDEDYRIVDDKRIAMNLNTAEDYTLLGNT